MVFSTAEI